MFWCIILVVLAIAYRKELKSIFEKVVFSLMETMRKSDEQVFSDVFKYPEVVASVVPWEVAYHPNVKYTRLQITFESGTSITVNKCTPTDGEAMDCELSWAKVKKGDVCTRLEIWDKKLHITTNFIPKDPTDLKFAGNDKCFCVVEE